MAKNILIFSDGTGQAGGLRPDQRLSNIYKLFRATRTGPDSPIDPAQQVAFYDPGLGTVTETGLVRLKTWDLLKAMAGSIAGLGISKNVVDCYEAILRLYEPGDRIYLFGFSRGAYTARSLAGVLYLCGIPTQVADGSPLPRAGHELRAIAEEAVRRVYDHGAGSPRDQYQPEREELGRRFRHKYKSGDALQATVHPYFIGLFDAVAALGSPPIVRFGLLALFTFLACVISAVSSWLLGTFLSWNFWPTAVVTLVILGLASAWLYVRSTLKLIRDFPKSGMFHFHFARWTKKHYDSFLDPCVDVVRHALSIDERRRDFPRVIWGGKKNIHAAEPGGIEPFQQIWFAGNHSDIGGSYPETESRLSDISLHWILEQATQAKHPILIDTEKLHTFPDSAGPQHCEVWSVSDRFYRWWNCWIRWPVQSRQIDPDAPLHPSVLERFDARAVLQCEIKKPYRPGSLREHDKVKHYY